jgi:hypothetical protein
MTIARLSPDDPKFIRFFPAAHAPPRWSKDQKQSSMKFDPWQIEQSLNDPAIRAEAAEVLRSLIDRIELRRAGDGQGMAAILYGELASILSLCSESGRKEKLPKAAASGSQLSVVAGACNHRELTLPPIHI